jgi:hypothetical protein
MRNVGEPEEQISEKSSSRILVPTAALFHGVDRIVVLDMKYIATLPPLDEESMLRGIHNARTQSAPSPDSTGGDKQ